MAVVEVKTLDRLGIGLGAPVHPHHAWMEKKNHLQVRQPLKEKTSCGDSHPVVALVAERLKELEAQREASSHRRLPFGMTNGLLPRLTSGNSRPISRRATWSPSIARQIALSTTTFCCGFPGAVYSRRITAKSSYSA